MSETSEKSRAKSPIKLNIPGDEALLNNLVRKRGITKGRLTRFSNHLSTLSSLNLVSPIQKADLKLRTRTAESIFREFNELQTKIEELVHEKDLEEQLDQRDQFENSYFSIVAQAECLLGSTEVSEGSSSPSPRIDAVKLPTITLPSFDGSCEHWLEYRDTFMSLIHESKHLSNIQKFHYLKSSLKGSAALVIEQLEFSSDNYNIALELLQNRYNNNNLLIHNHVKALFTVQKLTKESSVLLRKLIDSILKNLRALKILGEPTETWDTLINFIIVSKLDETTEREWVQYKNTTLGIGNDTKKRCKVDDLLGFLKLRADMLDTLTLSHSKPVTHSHKPSTKVNCNVSTTKCDRQVLRNRQCLMCKANHSLYSCNRFLNASIKDKLDFVRGKNLCENCLRTGHHKDECKFGTCRMCNKKHNSLLHEDINISNSSTTSLITNLSHRETGLSASNVQPQVTGDADYTYAAIDSIVVNSQIDKRCAFSRAILLSTALVEIADRFQRFHVVRALLDNGSQRCLITNSLCNKLQLPFIQSTHEIRGVGSTVTQSTNDCDVVIRSRDKTYTKRIRCIVLPNITSALPTVSIKRDQILIPSEYKLADPSYFETQPIDILLGADLFWDLIKGDKMRLRNGPFLLDTKLGWIISGPIHYEARRDSIIHCNFSQSIDAQLRQFWELEEIPKTYDTRTEEEIACEKHFVENTKRDSDGRFIVAIPFKEPPQVLGTSREQAERRFYSLEKRLNRDPTYKKLYCEFMREYCELGHMSRIDTHSNPHYFMPHHGVYREHSTTTKLRVVFDASAPTTSGKSLNDIQLVGPPIQGDLFSILLRFRQYKYIACGDIAKMFRNALIRPDLRDLQMILWRENSSLPLGIYQLNTITYGLASSPFLSIRCLRQLADECDDMEVKQYIYEDMYVDDYISGRDNKQDLLQLCNRVSNVLQGGCFPLRKWVFNFACEMSQSSLDLSKSLALTENSHSKTLGLNWYNLSDELYFRTQLVNNNNEIITKRVILSSVSQIYDPLGLLSPFIMIVKVILQKLWLFKLGWDDPVPQEVIKIWYKFVNDLGSLDTLRVPRLVIPHIHKYLELHIFTDASQTAYGTCVYVRTVSNNATVSVRLLCSKGKVAPVKPVSIPRLELCGALLGAKLFHKVHDSLRCKFKSITFWTDSTIVLGWLQMAPTLLQTFVQNRIVEIQELTKDIPWRHVRGKENPADLVSRGVGLDNLISSELWWQGPQFLSDIKFDSSVYVNSEVDIKQDELPELRPNKTHTFVCENNAEYLLFPFYRFSQYNRMHRACAHLLRFIYNIRNKMNRRSGAFTVEELKQSELILAKFSQLESFPNEHKTLCNGGYLVNKHLSRLNLFIDDNNLIRVGGRICNSECFAYSKKHPILLSSKHKFTILLFRYQHKQMLHAGSQTLLFNLRETWWPLGGRNLARKIAYECVTCTRFRGKTFSPLMGNLPVERVTANFPFYNCGVDYAGPVYILSRKGRGAKTCKAYICLFVCFATRAVHLELVTDLTSEAFLLALKRFISRRGKPQKIFSDNGRNFVGLSNDFQTFLKTCSTDIIEYATSENIQFSFIPSYAAHFGGLWEAGIRCCKGLLIRVIGNAHLTYEEFSTVLIQVEGILNSRPLTPLSSDSNDFLPLSPGHFLIGRPITAPVCSNPNTTEDYIHRLPRYQRVEQIRQHFWSRWNKEFISELQARSKWKHQSSDLQQDTLVIIKEDCSPPLKWQLGRIVSTYPGKDAISRVANVRTEKGIVKRAFSKLCPLFPLEAASSKAGGMSKNQSVQK